jgi:hypothetical protein
MAVSALLDSGVVKALPPRWRVHSQHMRLLLATPIRMDVCHARPDHIVRNRV